MRASFLAYIGILAVAGWVALAGPSVAAEGEGEALDPDVQAAVERTNKLQAELEKLQAQGSARANDPKYFFELGNLYSDLERREDAIGAYEAALGIKPDYVEVLVNLGAMLNETGKTDESIKVLTQAVEIRPDDPKVHVNLGNAYYSKGEYYPAVTEFRKALEIDSKTYEAIYQMGVAFADAGIYREAIREWKKVVEIAPDTEAAKSAQSNIDIVEKILARRL